MVAAFPIYMINDIWRHVKTNVESAGHYVKNIPSQGDQDPPTQSDAYYTATSGQL